MPKGLQNFVKLPNFFFEIVNRFDKTSTNYNFFNDF